MEPLPRCKKKKKQRHSEGQRHDGVGLELTPHCCQLLEINVLDPVGGFEHLYPPRVTDHTWPVCTEGFCRATAVEPGLSDPYSSFLSLALLKEF